MKTLPRACAGVLVSLTLLVGLILAGRLAIRGMWAEFAGFDRSLYRHYESIQLGMSRNEVIRRMGQPNDTSTQFHLIQERGYEKEYARAKASCSTCYLSWWSGDAFPVTYTVGFDTNDAVVVKAYGGS